MSGLTDSVSYHEQVYDRAITDELTDMALNGVLMNMSSLNQGSGSMGVVGAGAAPVALLEHVLSQSGIRDRIATQLSSKNLHVFLKLARVRLASPDSKNHPLHLDPEVTEDGKMINVWVPLNPYRNTPGLTVFDCKIREPRQYLSYSSGDRHIQMTWNEETQREIRSFGKTHYTPQPQTVVLFEGNYAPHESWWKKSTHIETRISIDMRVTAQGPEHLTDSMMHEISHTYQSNGVTFHYPTSPR